MNLTDFPQEVVRCRGVTLRKTAEGEITQDTEQGGESCQRDSTVTATVTALNGYSYGYTTKYNNICGSIRRIDYTPLYSQKFKKEINNDRILFSCNTEK